MWTKELRKEIILPHRVLPETIYEQLILADDTFRLQIYEDEDEPGTYYEHFVRMSGPLNFAGIKYNICGGTDKEEVKQRALRFLEKKFEQALGEIRENLTTER